MEEDGSTAVPTLSMWTSILPRLLCPCLNLVLSSQLSSDLVKPIISSSQELEPPDSPGALARCWSSTAASGICFDKVPGKGFVCPAGINSGSSSYLFIETLLWVCDPHSSKSLLRALQAKQSCVRSSSGFSLMWCASVLQEKPLNSVEKIRAKST